MVWGLSLVGWFSRLSLVGLDSFVTLYMMVFHVRGAPPPLEVGTFSLVLISFGVGNLHVYSIYYLKQ